MLWRWAYKIYTCTTVCTLQSVLIAAPQFHRPTTLRPYMYLVHRHTCQFPIESSWLQICAVCLTCRPDDVCGHHSASASHQLDVRHWQCSTVGDRSFAVAGARLLYATVCHQILLRRHTNTRKTATLPSRTENIL